MSWLRRSDDASEPGPVGLTPERIRGAIADLADRRDDAAHAASAALIGQVEVRHALREQRRQLQLALAQLDDALTLARRVADDITRADGDLAALPYRSNVEGLQVQREVIVGATGQLEALQDVSQSQVDAAREVLVRSRVVFDTALREQLRFLVTLERLERVRLLIAARAEARQQP